MPTIHGSPLSPFVRKLQAYCHEKGFAYALEPTNPFAVPDDFRRLSPLGRIPAFVDDDGFAVADSSVIIAYLERRHPRPPLIPDDARAAARVLFLEELADTDLGRALCTPLYERRFKPRFLGEPADEREVERALCGALPPLLDYLEGLDPDTSGIVDGRISVADLALASPFVNFRLAGEELDAERWPRLARYVAGIHARPSYRGLELKRS